MVPPSAAARPSLPFGVAHPGPYLRHATGALPGAGGTEDELQILLDALDGAVAGRGRTAVVLGEAGAGKSRMVRELAGAAGARPAGDDPALAAPIGDALVETLPGRPGRPAFGLGQRLLARLDRAPGRPPGRVGLRLRLARAAVAAGRWPVAADHLAAAMPTAGSTTPATARA
jgi:hypothetical protein